MKRYLVTAQHRQSKRFFSVLSVSSVVRFTLLLLFVVPHTASACAVCFGASDSPWAKALSWGIIVLLVVVLTVLGGIVAFFMHMAKRSRMVQSAANQEELQP
jgi:hypothetical protein